MKFWSYLFRERSERNFLEFSIFDVVFCCKFFTYPKIFKNRDKFWKSVNRDKGSKIGIVPPESAQMGSLVMRLMKKNVFNFPMVNNLWGSAKCWGLAETVELFLCFVKFHVSFQILFYDFFWANLTFCFGSVDTFFVGFEYVLWNETFAALRTIEFWSFWMIFLVHRQVLFAFEIFATLFTFECLRAWKIKI